MRRLVAAFSVAVLFSLMAGCGSSDSESTSTEAAPSTTTQLTGTEVIEIIFDGTECTVSRDSVRAGEQAFVLTNNSDIKMLKSHIYVGNVPEGYTYQDLIDRQTDFGGPPNTVPTHVWEIELGIRYERTSFSARPDIELADNQTLAMSSLTPGTDFIELYNNANPSNDWQQWLCAPAFEVAP